ncbi:hypothetical protein [Streptomyces goshikiensis]|uniref:aromatic-ring hydroxylase C-terminal domain-containing protein n=1 Tax=Streptomyces goshikiensis TaxID=1942 RepID=UPI0039965C38
MAVTSWTRVALIVRRRVRTARGPARHVHRRTAPRRRGGARLAACAGGRDARRRLQQCPPGRGHRLPRHPGRGGPLRAADLRLGAALRPGGGTAIRWSARRCRGSGWTTAAGRLELLRGSSEGAGVSGLLVRPDGFVAWASATGGTAGLEAALTRWLGDARKG